MSSNGKTMVFKLKFYRKIENDSIIVFKWKKYVMGDMLSFYY